MSKIATKADITQSVRDTTQWYTDVDPMSLVDPKLVDFVHQRAGRVVLDLGCGTGGYAKRLTELGHTVQALDINPAYVKIARSIGVDAKQFDGDTIPLPDNSVDTVFLLEVLEHVPQPDKLVAELKRVTRGNVLASVPNNTQNFEPAPVTWSHMLEIDHKNFFTATTFRQLFEPHFTTVNVQQVEPVDRALLAEVLPRGLFYLYRLADNLKLVQPRYHFRLLAEVSGGR